jgi:uncharacterized protein (DUF1015 family)
VADVRPFRALRYRPGTDLSVAISPPFDVISPEEQRELYARSAVNAVRIELADEAQGDRYEQSSETVREWRKNGLLRREGEESFYLYRQTFWSGPDQFTRSILFARLRLEPWDAGVVLPHEQTFGGPKEDRLKLLRAIHLNTSPVYLLYRDNTGRISKQVEAVLERQAETNFKSPDGQQHALRKIEERAVIEELRAAFADETLYIADGHHRYETAIAYRDEVRAAAGAWTGEEPENFVMVALTAADDPGLLVLPIHRVTSGGTNYNDAIDRLRELFELDEQPPGPGKSAIAVATQHATINLSVKDATAIDAFLPQDRSPAWRRLDYSIANQVVLQHCLGLRADDMSDYDRLWFTEDAGEAIAELRSGKALYAVLMQPVPVGRVLELADAGERMPQKSTFFYPKVPTGLVFNPLEGRAVPVSRRDAAAGPVGGE